MRRMITKNGVIDAVNAGIESGEIEVGGGLPEFSEADTGRVLTVIEDAETGDPKASWEDAAGGGDSFNGVYPIKTDNTYTVDTAGGFYISPSDMTKTYVYSGKEIKASLFLDQTSNYPATDNKTIDGNATGCLYLGKPYYNSRWFYLQDASGSLIMNPTGTSDSFNRGSKLTIQNSIIDGKVNYSNRYIGHSYLQNSLIVSNGFTGLNLMGTEQLIILGDQNEYIGNATWPYASTGACVLGYGNLMTHDKKDYNLGKILMGKCGSLNTTSTDILAVGAGQSTSSRANCFATGNDGTEDYIKVGETKITESQLQALLALLNQ